MYDKVAALYEHSRIDTVYTKSFEECKIHGFRCKLAESKILILQKKQWQNLMPMYLT